MPGNTDDVPAVGCLDRQGATGVDLDALAGDRVGALGQAVAVDQAEPVPFGRGAVMGGL